MATSDDERLYESEAEVDSEIEDNDLDNTFGQLLEQLNSEGGISMGGHSDSKYTPMHEAVDLDAILGDLCELQAQISTQQHDIDTDIQKSSDIIPSSSPNYGVVTTEQPSFNYEWDNAIDTELQGALDALSELTRDDSNDNGSSKSVSQSKPADFPTSSSSEFSFYGCETSSQTGTIKRQPVNGSGGQCSNKKPPVSPTRGSVCEQKNATSSNNGQRLSAGALINNGSTYQNFEQDLSPVSLEIDSAFSDTLSLPSSGSHGSVATSGSQHSGGSQNSSGSGTSSGVGSSGGDGPPVSPVHKAMFTRLNSLQDQLSKENIPPNEQANKLKAEKLKIALEKIKEANIKKLFVRAHTADGCSKSILADEHMTVAHVVDILMAKNHVNPNLNWSLVEQTPELHMERLMEDHDNLVEYMLYWARDSPNKIFFEERTDKYSVFSKPEKYLVPEKKDDEEYTEAKREGLIKEYFDETNVVAPELEGMLYLKAEGKKAWKKFFFVLRASGLYYNQKGKSKSSKDLICLQKFDFADVYVGINWKKKFKSPTDYGFALKHPQIQKKSKYIKYVACDDGHTLEKWVSGIRIAKYGHRLKQNYETVRNNITTFSYRDVVPNPNFNDYIAKHNEVVEKYSKTGHRISKTEDNVPDFGRRATSMRESKSTSLKQHRNSTASVTSASSRSSMQSGSSGGGSNNRSPIKVVIPPPRSGSGNITTGNDDIHGEVAGNIAMHNSAGGSYSTVIMNNSASSSSSFKEEQQQSEIDVFTLRRASDTIKRESMSRTSSGEAFEDIPSCGIPSLPVTTKITKLITEQHALSGTLRQPSQSRKIKKSSSKGSDIDITDLPPPPPDPMLNNIDEFLPPPPDDMLLPPPPSSQTLEEISCSVVEMSSKVSHTRAASTCLPINNSNTQSNRCVSGSGIPVQQQYNDNNINNSFNRGQLIQDGVAKSAPTTPKKVPPPPPPKRTEIGWGSNHSNISTYQSNPQTSTTHVTAAAPPPTAPKTTFFINDLQRVLNEKHSRFPHLGPSSKLPPEPPMPFQSRMDLNPEPSFDDLPPPPAELLEDLRVIKKKAPPPPPKRKM